MNLLRKVFWPSAIALTVLVAMGAMGKGVTNVAAQPDIIEICGPSQIAVGETELYVFLTHDYDGPVVADLDDDDGDTDITSATQQGEYRELDEDDYTDFLEFVHAVAFNDEPDDPEEEPNAEAGEAVARDLESHFDSFDLADCYGMTADDLEDDVDEAIKALIREGVIDCGTPNVCTAAVISAIVDALAEAIAGGEFECEDLADIAENAAINGGAGPVTAALFADAIEDFCFDGAFGDIDSDEELPIPTAIGAVDVTCMEPGEFDLSFVIRDIPLGGASAQIEVLCKGEVETGTITAVPTTVEITPSIGNVAHSLIWVTLSDIEGGPVPAGIEVLFTTDRCSIESSAVDTEAEFEAANALFGPAGLSVYNPATAAAVESSVAATTAPDSASRQQEETATFWVFTGPDNIETARAAVVLHCDPIHAPGVTPGPAVVTAYVERGSLDDDIFGNDDDLVLRTTVTVVGPPAANGLTVTASPATLACGEKATINITVLDAIGQNVSDHTFVEIVTNAGGVLAGTGAVAGQAGLVSPISSTVAETFGGKAIAYLLTSTAHVGKYEVVVTTGGGGGVTGQLQSGGVSTNLLGGLFTTQPISVQVTVECTVPAVPVNVQVQVPTTTGPQTGQGIRPPSTGDAGLASTESNWVVGAVAAVVASLVVAGFAVKLARDEN